MFMFVVKKQHQISQPGKQGMEAIWCISYEYIQPRGSIG
jgi:hypothetical protein